MRIVDYKTSADDYNKSVTPQMLLVCCWRTLKEISLFFGDIIKNLEIEGEHQNYLLTSKRVSENF